MVSACAASNDDPGDTGLGPYSDAGPAPLDPTRDVAGRWEWALTEVGATVPVMTCKVSVGGGLFDIVCPQGLVPRDIGLGCRQLRDDRHFFGSIGADRLDGMQDTLVQYEGDGCVTYGYTTGAPFPQPAFAQLSATREVSVTLGDFLPHLGGRWAWAIDNRRDAAASLRCEIDVGARTDGITVAVRCLDGEAEEILPGCTRQAYLAIDASVLPGVLDGTLGVERRHEGTCGTLPERELELRARMRALPLDE